MYISLYITTALWLSGLIELVMIKRKLVRVGRYDHAKKEYYYEEGEYSKGLWYAILVLSALGLFGLGFLHGFYSMLMPMHLYFIYVSLIRLSILWIVYELTDEKAFLQKLPKVEWTTIKATVAILVVCLPLILLLAWPGFIPRTIGYTRASVMKSIINEFKLGSVAMFPEIRPEELRLTTSAIAKSIAETKKTSGASWITSVHLGMYNGTLSWICTVSERPLWGSLLVGDSNRIKELIVVPVNDATGEKSKVVTARMFYSEGLWWQNDIRVHAADRFPLRTFSRGYVTENDEGRLVIVSTSYFEMPFGALYDPKIHVWDTITGELLGEYSPSNAPAWVVQRWDEEFVELMGDEFGDFRLTANNDLDYWIGTFYFSDRSADPSEPEGLRYQLWNGEITAVYIFDNKKNEEVMELLLIARKEGMYLYSMDHLKFIGPDDAKETAISGLPALTGERTYATPLALLYRIGSDVYYHIPIYTFSEGHYYPAYFALVRASDRFLVRKSCGAFGGMIGAVKAAYETLGAAPGPEPTEGTMINGTVVEKPESTRQWLTIKTDDGKTLKVLVKYELLKTDEEKAKIVYTKVGDRLSLLIDENGIVLKVL